jgi:membrane associated rhomboid family serine protease
MRLADKADRRLAPLGDSYELCAAIWTGPRAALVGIYEPPRDASAGPDLAARLEAARRWGHERLSAQGAATCDILLVATLPIAGSIQAQAQPGDPVHAGAAWVDPGQGSAGDLLPIPPGMPSLGELRAAARLVAEGRPVPTLAAVDLAERQTVAGGYVAPVRRATITQPVVTYTLIGALVAIYLLELALRSRFPSPGFELVAFGALGNRAGVEDWWRFVSYGAVHDNTSVFHILFNCLFLFWIGRMVEQLYGRLVLLGTFMITSVLGALFWIGVSAVAPSLSPAGLTLGASGGLSGLVGLLLVMGRVQGRDVPAGVATSVRNYAIIVIALNVAFAFLFRGGANNFVHLGGVIVGALLGLVLPPLRRIGGRDLALWEQGALIGVLAVSALALAVAAANLVTFPATTLTG